MNEIIANPGLYCLAPTLSVAALYIGYRVNKSFQNARRSRYANNLEKHAREHEVFLHLENVDGPIDLDHWEDGIKKGILYLIDDNYRHKTFRKLYFITQYASLGDMKNVKVLHHIGQKAFAFDRAHPYEANFKAEIKKLEDEYDMVTDILETYRKEKNKYKGNNISIKEDEAQAAAKRAKQLIIEMSELSEQIYITTTGDIPY